MKKKKLKEFVILSLIFILIIACIFNIMTKLVHKVSLKTELETSATYVNQEKNKNLDEDNKNN